MVRAMVAGKSFLDEDSPFEGMTPKDIEVLVEKVKAERAMQSLQENPARKVFVGRIEEEDPFEVRPCSL